MNRILLSLLILVPLATATLAQAVATVRSVEVRGNRLILRDAIIGAMQTRAGGVLSRAQLTADETAILDLGFFADVTISVRDATPTESEVFVDVVENPIVREVQVQGNTVVSTEAITAAVVENQPIGQVLNLRNLRGISEAIRRLYEAEGFFVQLEDLSPDDTVPETLVVRVLEPRVNEITLTGLTRTRAGVIRRIMRTKPGEAYSQRQFREDLENLFHTHWFENLDYSERLTDRPGFYDLGIDFREARTALVNMGVALDPQSRLVGMLSFTDANFMGTGRSVGVNLSQAAAGGGLGGELSFGDRFLDEHGTQFSARVYSKLVYNFTNTGLGAFGQADGDERFDERRTGVSLNVSRPIREEWRASVGITAQNIRTIDLKAIEGTEFIQQDGDLFSLVLGVDFDTRRPMMEPHSGNLARFTLEPGMSNITKIGGTVAGDEDILGRNTFLKAVLEYRHYWSRPLPEDAPWDQQRPVIAFRSRLGHVFGRVPFFEQLFVGGADSLRGYPNQRFWGSSSLLFSGEYRHPIQRAFSLIAFVDYGGAWGGYGKFRDYDQSDDPRLRLGYGLGLAFRTPMGPIRIDFGFNQEGESRTHFSFGTSF